jgi:hypothetical protein
MVEMNMEVNVHKPGALFHHYMEGKIAKIGNSLNFDAKMH